MVTPGEANCGARRIVTGSNGERCWTDDHDVSVAEIIGSGLTTSQGAG
jgi:guanyl-specific ribonuclease Sa